MLCSRRRWPYVFISNAPPSLWPSQRETVGMSTPLSMHRVANKCRKSWWVMRSAPTFFAARSSDFWHSPTRNTFASDDSPERSPRIRSNNARASGISGTRRTVQFFVPVSGSPRMIISPASKSTSRHSIWPASPFRKPVNANPRRKSAQSREAPPPARSTASTSCRNWSPLGSVSCFARTGTRSNLAAGLP